MTKQEKNLNNLPPKKHQPIVHAIEAVQKKQEKEHKLEREHINNFIHNPDGVKHAATECMSINSNTVSALMESGNITSRILRDINEEIAESGNRFFSDSIEISREVFGCRTFTDMIALQNKALEQACNSYFDTTNKISSLLFDSCTEALAPIRKRTAIASDKIQKALAA